MLLCLILVFYLKLYRNQIYAFKCIICIIIRFPVPVIVGLCIHKIYRYDSMHSSSGGIPLGNLSFWYRRIPEMVTSKTKGKTSLHYN